jgi:hypothetical protein
MLDVPLVSMILVDSVPFVRGLSGSRNALGPNIFHLEDWPLRDTRGRRGIFVYFCLHVLFLLYSTNRIHSLK